MVINNILEKNQIDIGGTAQHVYILIASNIFDEYFIKLLSYIS